MNLVNGKIISSKQCDLVLQNIDNMILETLSKPPLDINLVINACDFLVKNIDKLEIINKLPTLGLNQGLVNIYIVQIKQMLSAEFLTKRLELELGEIFHTPRKLTYMHSNSTATQTIAPLGVLFHITAGNVDGLPFISLIEGLLTGNINILKLPKEEGGITVGLLLELFKIEPALKEYIYVFDYSSKDVYAMSKFAKIADAVVVWGGDEAISAIRKMVSPNTKIIEWGHKISFAYVTKDGINKTALEKLALNICFTNQLFCSSCQGVFFDTDNMDDIYDFAEKFLVVLDDVSKKHPFNHDETTKLFMDAEITLNIYNRQIEKHKTKDRIFKTNECSIIASRDSKLETSMMYKNIWVKPLKRSEILKLRPYKSYLQTVALICGDNERKELSQKILQTGVVKISDGFDMSNYAFGEAHDGVFALRNYTRIVSVQD